jgi:rod shape determining protein RodA
MLNLIIRATERRGVFRNLRTVTVKTLRTARPLPPVSIPLISAALLACGWMGIARSEDVANAPAGSAHHQLIWSAVAFALLLGLAATNYRAFGRWSYGALAVVLVALLAVFLFPSVNGAHRWIRAAGIGFQPSEFAKLAVTLALARYLAYRDIGERFGDLLPPLVIALVPVWLVLKEPDLGTSLVFVPVLFAMLFAAGARRRHLMALALIGVSALPALWAQMSHDQRSRVTALWQQDEPDRAPTPAGYHLHQAKRMFALGGFWGSALARSDDDDQEIDRRVPEPQTDSIFCVIGERYGIAGCGLVLLLYGLLIWRGLAIAEQTREPFGRLIVVGVMATIGFQVVINTGMLVGLLPITGLPLPLVSYGGSGLIAGEVGLGLVMSIAVRPGYE